MPVRALRHIILPFEDAVGVLGPNPINARKGIKTDAQDLGLVEGLGPNPINARKGIKTEPRGWQPTKARRPNPINARKGIKTYSRCYPSSFSQGVQIPSMPVRALRLTMEPDAVVRQISPNPINARKGIKTLTADELARQEFQSPNPINARKGIKTCFAYPRPQCPTRPVQIPSMPVRALRLIPLRTKSHARYSSKSHQCP